MNNRRAHIITILAILSVTALACAAAANLVATPTPPPTATPTITPTPTITLTPTITVTPTPHYTVELGRPVTARSGGFSVSRVDGYDLASTVTRVSLTSKDENVRVLMMALPPQPTGPASFVRAYLQKIQENYSEVEPTDVVKETQGTIATASAEFNASRDGKPVHGRITVYEPQNSKVVILLVMTFGDQRWEREGQQVFEKVSGSLQFQPIEVWQACPVTKNPEYGTSPNRPILIGGGLNDGEQRIENYLDALLGPRGEYVTYGRVGTHETSGVTLEEYNTYYGNTRRTLYFDIYKFEDLRAPLSMQCSAPLPAAPAQ